MSPELRDGLRGLCRSHGWAYGVFWRIDRRDPRLLVMEDSFYEEHIGAEIDKIISHVQVVGEGNIGAAAMIGKHQWIYSDTYGIESNLISSHNGNAEIFKGIDELQHQFSAGIKTVVIVPLPSFGVVQFGSPLKNDESLEFIYQVLRLFHLLDAMNRETFWGGSCSALKICDPNQAFSSMLPSLHSNNSLHDVISKELQADVQSSTTASSCPSRSLPGSLSDTRYCSGNTNPHSSIMAGDIGPTGASCSIGNPFQKLPSIGSVSSSHVTSQFGILNADPYLSLTHNNKHFSHSYSIGCSQLSNLLTMPDEKFVVEAVNSLETVGDRKVCSATVPTQLLSDDLFEGMELDLSPKVLWHDCWDDLIMPVGDGKCSNLSSSVSDGISDLDMGFISVADKGLFPDSSFEQAVLEIVVGESANLSSIQHSRPASINSIDCPDFDHQVSAMARLDYPQFFRNQTPVPEFNLEKMMQGPSGKENFSFTKGEAYLNSHVSSWIDDNCSISAESAGTKKSEETAKVARKRARPGESTRPRPKDRQHIQDRVKELREIVPNATKCSIDSLLDRTIKHMLFLQSVTKYADKLKQQRDEPKLIGDKSGVILKDNSGSGSSGATWAYEVAGQTMVCPILVEDLNPPGQMLVEMLCEDHGFFLEIADIIRGFGLTILKGLMEMHSNKIWARFLVEANRDVTRMDIFLSLVQLSQQTSGIRSDENQTKAIDKGISTKIANYQQSLVSIPVGLSDLLH